MTTINLRSKHRPQQKSKANEPSARDKLSADFTRRLEEKWREKGDDVLEAAFKESPTKIAEMIARLVSVSVPTATGYGDCQSQQELAVKLLSSIGVVDPTEETIEQVVFLNKEFAATLESIRARAEGQIN
jgi:hypothetical protein